MAYFIRCRVSLPPHPINHLFYLLLIGFHNLPQPVYHLPLGCEFIHNTALDFNGRKGETLCEIINYNKKFFNNLTFPRFFYILLQLMANLLVLPAPKFLIVAPLTKNLQ